MFSEPREIWLLGHYRADHSLSKATQGLRGTESVQNVVSTTVLFFPIGSLKSSQIPLMRFGLLPHHASSSPRAQLWGGGEYSFIPCWGKWNPALHLLHGRSKITYRLVLSNKLRGESSYLGGLCERERGDRRRRQNTQLEENTPNVTTNYLSILGFGMILIS